MVTKVKPKNVVGKVEAPRKAKNAGHVNEIKKIKLDQQLNNGGVEGLERVSKELTGSKDETNGEGVNSGMEARSDDGGGKSAPKEAQKNKLRSRSPAPQVRNKLMEDKIKLEEEERKKKEEQEKKWLMRKQVNRA